MFSFCRKRVNLDDVDGDSVVTCEDEESVGNLIPLSESLEDDLIEISDDHG